MPVNLNCVFKGNTGTGKTYLARYLANAYHSIGMLSKGSFVEVQVLSLAKGNGIDHNIAELAKRGMGGVVLIDEVHRVTDMIGILIKQIEKLDDDIAFILCGLKEPLDEYFKNNPDDLQRLGRVWEFPDFSDADLSKIAIQELKNAGFLLSEDADLLISAYIVQEKSDKNVIHKNGWLIKKHVLNKICERQSNRLAAISAVSGCPLSDNDLKTIIAKDIPVVPPKPLEEVLASLDDFIGLDAIKQEIKALADTLKVQKESLDSGSRRVVSAHMCITGNPGTGKTTIARKLGEVFRSIGLLPVGQVVEVDGSKLVAPYVGQTGLLVQQRCNEAMGGILFIDEAYALKPEHDFQASYGQEAIETLLKRMEDDRGKFVVIVAGYKEPMNRFMAANEGLKSRFSKFFDLPDYSPEDLYLILDKNISLEGNLLTPDAIEAAKGTLQERYRLRGPGWANGREMRTLLDEMIQKRAMRLSAMPNKTKDDFRTFIPEDIPRSFCRQDTTEANFAELDALIGLASVKKDLHGLYEFTQVQKLRETKSGRKGGFGSHFVFSGNPGTGKTIVARLLGRMLYSIGQLPTPEVVEKSGKDLIGQYVGDTPKKVNAIVDQALGKVLFIDEAYTLTPESGQDGFSKEAVETLLKRLEDDRGKFVCIVAGYDVEMHRFLESNAGLKSRFTNFLHFDDYTADQLALIYQNFATVQGYTLTKEADQALGLMMKSIYGTRDRNFANARDVRKCFENSLRRQASRLSRLIKTKNISLDEKMLFTLEADDIVTDALEPEFEYEPLEELEKMVGLASVKKEVAELVQFLKIEAERAKAGGIQTNINLHMVLMGNPGTGKTTVARVLGKVLKKIGLLDKGHVIETDRSGLVAGFIGQTAIKTQKKIDEAMGGILFIDEAYSLSPENAGFDFGKEAIETLLKRMEDDRGKFVVFVAGYEQDMKKFLASNEGLNSRFAKFIHFEDYSAEEMSEIFMGMLRAKRLSPEEGLDAAILSTMTSLCENKDGSFANGRTVRNYFERCLQRQSMRLSTMVDRNAQDLVLFKVEDLV